MASQFAKGNNHSTFSSRKTKIAQISKKIGNLRAIELILGHTKMDSAIQYLSVELEDARAISEAIKI